MTLDAAAPPIVGPDDPGYDTARLAWNLAADLRPAGVAVCTSADEVAAVVRRAADEGLRVAPLSSGHLACALPDLEGTILLKTAIAGGVEVDEAALTARVPGGTLWGEVCETIGDRPMACLSGSSHDVGVAGYTLGGGLSWLGRKYGMAVNHVRAVELVTADGRLVRASAEEEPELFWAVRGAAGSFGVVTHLELELVPVGEVFAGIAIWDVEHASDILGRWNAWAADAPDEVSTSARVLNIPPIPEMPPMLQGRNLVAIDGAVIAGEAEARELIRPWHEGPEPIMDTWGLLPPHRLTEIHMDPPEPVPGAGDGRVLGALDDDGIERWIELCGPGAPLLQGELRQLGGAFARRPPGAGAIGSLAGAYAAYAVGMAMTPELGGAIKGHLERVYEAMAPWELDRQYTNFLETPGQAAACFDADAYARLRELHAQWDPEHRLVAAHGVGD